MSKLVVANLRLALVHILFRILLFQSGWRCLYAGGPISICFIFFSEKFGKVWIRPHEQIHY